MRWWKWTAIALIAILALGYGVLSHFMGGPRDVYGFLRYALPHWHRGDLRVGNAAPDVELDVSGERALVVDGEEGEGFLAQHQSRSEFDYAGFCE